MEAELYYLIHRRLWTEFLQKLGQGSRLFNFPEAADIRSCASVAYRLNKDVQSRKYKFIIGNDNYVTIEVKNA